MRGHFMQNNILQNIKIYLVSFVGLVVAVNFLFFNADSEFIAHNNLCVSERMKREGRVKKEQKNYVTYLIPIVYIIKVSHILNILCSLS